jgi:hypothetical protein
MGIIHKNKNQILFMEDDENGAGTNYNLESQSKLRRTFDIESKNIKELQGLLNSLVKEARLNPKNFEELTNIVDSKGKNLTDKQLSGAINEIRNALDKSPIVSKNLGKISDDLIEKLSEIKERPLIKELENAKSKLTTWNRLFDKKTYLEAEATLKNRDNLKKLNQYAEKIMGDKEIPEKTRNKLMEKVAGFVKDITNGIDKQIKNDEKEIAKLDKKLNSRAEKMERSDKKINTLNAKLSEAKKRSSSIEDDLISLDKIKAKNPEIRENLNRISTGSLEKLGSFHGKKSELEDKIQKKEGKQENRDNKQGTLKSKQEVYQERVNEKQGMKNEIEQGVGKHLKKYHDDKAAAHTKGNARSK